LVPRQGLGDKPAGPGTFHKVTQRGFGSGAAADLQALAFRAERTRLVD